MLRWGSYSVLNSLHFCWVGTEASMVSCWIIGSDRYIPSQEIILGAWICSHWTHSEFNMDFMGSRAGTLIERKMFTICIIDSCRTSLWCTGDEEDRWDRFTVMLWEYQTGLLAAAQIQTWTVLTTQKSVISAQGTKLQCSAEPKCLGFGEKKLYTGNTSVGDPLALDWPLWPIHVFGNEEVCTWH